eukprot:TRINITY_DN15544_c1_g1_i1.p1 TRINITY_DN15544_c1_g1~~TRINITY_DN15544_c1_g1_i1.p1  ORF type:complete len:141 (-),score=36.53 TRINITY_DN15544_c1_g1_i1:158-550(-)
MAAAARGVFKQLEETIGFTLARRFGEAYKSLAGYRQYGLVADDLIVETDDVKEAVRRLPPQIRENRNRRMKIALDCSAKNNKILPKEQWTKTEEDVHYLIPYLERVVQERQEREAFRAQTGASEAVTFVK